MNSTATCKVLLHSMYYVRRPQPAAPRGNGSGLSGSKQRYYGDNSKGDVKHSRRRGHDAARGDEPKHHHLLETYTNITNLLEMT